MEVITTPDMIVLQRDNYETLEDFSNGIRDVVMSLLKNDYIMTVRYDEKGLGIVAIEFGHNDVSYGGSYPMWLTGEEYEQSRNFIQTMQPRDASE